MLEPISATLAANVSDVAIGAVVEIWSPTFQKTTKRSVEVKGTSQPADRELLKKYKVQEKAKNISEHINMKELVALLTTIKRYKEELKGRSIVWFADSVATKSSNRETRNPSMGDNKRNIRRDTEVRHECIPQESAEKTKLYGRCTLQTKRKGVGGRRGLERGIEQSNGAMGACRG